MKDFVVDDDAVEGEYGDEESKSRGNEEDEAAVKKRHKKKRKHRERELSDEDLELIQENTGKNIKVRKRIQKVSELERVHSAVDEERALKLKGEED